MDTILFDLDDTLIESMYVWGESITNLFKYLNIDMDFDRAKQTFISMRLSEVLEYIKKYFGARISIEEMNDYVMTYVKHQYEFVVPEKKGAREFVCKCDHNNIQMAVLTSNELGVAQLVLKRLGILSYMKEIFSAEALHMTKREPEIYLYALQHMEADPSSTVVFEDSMYAIKTASSLGIHCIGLLNDWNCADFKANRIQTIRDFREIHINSFLS